MERVGELRSVKVMRHILSALVFVVVASSTASAQSYRCDNGSKAASGLKRYIVRLVSAQEFQAYIIFDSQWNEVASFAG